MSDIFISYKREEQPVARKLADALEGEGWTVWWDPKLRAGERFNDVIETALNEAKCVIVLWSKRSVESLYVKDEATHALKRKKLVPVTIQQVELPFRFEELHTPSLCDWDGSKDASAFLRLVEDIAAKLGSRVTKDEKGRPDDTQSTPERALQEDESKLKPGTVFRDTLKDGSQGPEMVVIPTGTFQMGGNYESRWRPVHTVEINSPFALSKYQMTFEEYDRFATATGRQLPGDEGWGRSQRPVINVSRNDGVEYANWLSAQTAKRYRLPSEAEWEYTARSAGTWAGMAREWALREHAWYEANSGGKTQPVGGKKPNGLGLYDMSGNVWEWVQDWWIENYEGAPTDGTAWFRKGGAGQGVIRGGSWNCVSLKLRPAYRNSTYAGDRSNGIGFRLAQDLD